MEEFKKKKFEELLEKTQRQVFKISLRRLSIADYKARQI